MSGEAGTVPMQARRDHTRIVEHEAIAGFEVTGKVAELAVLPTPFGTVNHEHARGGAVGERLLRNPFRRELKIKVGNNQTAMIAPCGIWA